jgi:hypothetical protein
VADQVTLGRELLVRLDDHAAGDTQVRRERPTGRQRGARGQSARPDDVTDGGRDLAVQRDRRVAMQLDQQVAAAERIGPRSRHRIGPYRRTRLSVRVAM